MDSIQALRSQFHESTQQVSFETVLDSIDPIPCPNVDIEMWVEVDLD